ncbi:MAG: hypothetical protein ACI9NC_004922 [Verrucomicrobiales bacterium]|jgi:hypothetical protein
MTTLRPLILLLALIPALGFAQLQDQYSIGINFEGGQANPALSGPGTAKVVCPAGIFEAPNWNNFPDWSGTDEALISNFGSALTATASFAVQNNWAATNTAPGDGGNGDLMSGQLDNLQGADAGGTPNFITVAGLGIEFTDGGYDIYIYQNADSGTESAGFVIDGVTRYLFQAGGAGTNYPLTDVGNINGFVTSTATDPFAATSSNVVVFENMTTAEFTITGAPGAAGGARPRPNGIQIVSRGGITDADSDGLEAVFESNNGLDDADDGSTDVDNGPAGDPDLDTLSNLDEQNAGTHPNMKDTDMDGLDDNVENKTGIFVDGTMTGSNPTIADSDGDGLLDGAEVNGDPFDSDPNNPDTDGDTLGDASELDANPFVTDPANDDTDGDSFSDATELALGTDPTDQTSFPVAGTGSSIAINFNSNRETAAALLTEEIAGFPLVAQGNWNSSDGGADDVAGANGTELNIITPEAGVLVDSEGGNVSTKVTWTSNGTWNTNNGIGSPDAKVMNGYIDAIGAGGFTTIDFTDIPYPKYDVYVYFGSDGNGRTGAIESTTAGVTYSYSTFSNDPNGGGGFDPANDYILTTDTAVGNPNANYCVFTEQTTADFSLHINRGSNNSGIHGIQIVGTEPQIPLKITSIVYDEDTNMVTLEWNSIPDTTYAIDVSNDIKSWPGDVEDSIKATEDTHTETFLGPTDGSTRIFYRVRVVTE